MIQDKNAIAANTSAPAPKPAQKSCFACRSRKARCRLRSSIRGSKGLPIPISVLETLTICLPRPCVIAILLKKTVTISNLTIARTNLLRHCFLGESGNDRATFAFFDFKCKFFGFFWSCAKSYHNFPTFHDTLRNNQIGNRI